MHVTLFRVTSYTKLDTDTHQLQMLIVSKGVFQQGFVFCFLMGTSVSVSALFVECVALL